VSLDDLLAVLREFLNPDVSRSGLDRCLRRHGVGNLRDLRRVSDLLCMKKLAHASNYRSMTTMTISKELLDELLSGVDRPED